MLDKNCPGRSFNLGRIPRIRDLDCHIIGVPHSAPVFIPKAQFLVALRSGWQGERLHAKCPLPMVRRCFPSGPGASVLLEVLSGVRVQLA